VKIQRNVVVAAFGFFFAYNTWLPEGSALEQSSAAINSTLA